MASREYLSVCESFYSIQGEGKTAGKPAVFLRLAGCNLRCNGFSYQDPDTGKHLGCDSKLVWMQGVKRRFKEILDYWGKQGWLQSLQKGAHLVITGGEPLLQQAALENFICQLDRCITNNIFLEMETNATLLPNDYLKNRINQFNVSPKLKNSGESVYNFPTLQQFSNIPTAIFKFVISEPNDVDEVVAHYVEPLSLESTRVWLMPEGGTQSKINAIKPWLVELCKQHLFNFTSRLQVDIWSEVTGV